MSPATTVKSAAEETEEEELRAKAIASMPSSTNPNPNSPLVSSQSKEDGELSPEVASAAAVAQELLTCPTVISNLTTLEDKIPTKAVDNNVQQTKSAKTPPYSSTSMPNMQIRSSIARNYSKHFKKVKVPFKSSNNQSLSWHGKGSDNNLVISFSDDDSGSNSEESKLEKTANRKDNIVRVNKSDVQRAATIFPSGVSQGGSNTSRLVTGKGLVNPAQVSSSRHLVTSTEKDSSISRHSISPSIKIPTNQEHGHVRDADVADNRLATLRHEIAVRENKLKVQSRSLSQNNEKHAGISRPASVAGIGLTSKESTMKRLKVDDGSNSTQRSVSQLQLPKPEVLLKLKNNGPSVPKPITMYHNPEVSSKPGNHSKEVTDITRSCDMSENRDMAVGYPNSDDPCLPQTKPNTKDGALNDLRILRNQNSEHTVSSNRSRRTNASSLIPNKASAEHGMISTHQLVETAGARIPLETSSQISERLSGLNGKSGNKEASLQETNFLNYSSQINISGEAPINLQSLVELEELQDKELEEAQELRRKCELEERHALKAYRKAQRALMDANEKCSLVYRKRELFSAQLRALLLQASSSMWPSSWQSPGGTVSESVRTIPEARFDMLYSSAPAEGQFLGQLAGESITGCLEDARIASQPNAPEHCLEQGAGTSNRQYNNASDSEIAPGHHVNMSTDDDENISDHRFVEPRLAPDTTQGNHGQIAADKNPRDYELLEASLRSKLVRRLGSRMSSKNNKVDAAEPLVQEEDNNDVRMSFPLHQQMQGGRTEILELEGVKRTRNSTTQLTGELNSQSHEDGLSLPDEDHRSADHKYYSYPPKESCSPNRTTFSILPSSVLHVVFRHAEFIKLSCFSESQTTDEREALFLHRKITEGIPKGQSIVKSTITEVEPYNSDLAIDPLWPFCMFELRGKCNNEECRWQHIKSCTLRHSKLEEYLGISCSGYQVRHLATVGKSFLSSLPVPTYHIGSSLIKVDPYLSRSVMARSVWQYWQRGFCASFPLPFSVQRSLPLDAPSFQTGANPISEDYSWNRRSLYLQTLDNTAKQVQGFPESEQSLEMAIDLFDGTVSTSDRRKALCILSQAIEANPTSVALWIVYLHAYYAKEKNIGKDDMFFHAVHHNEASYELWLMYINSRVRLVERLNAYQYALTTLCHKRNNFDNETVYFSSCILDIFLQMLDFLCMSGNVEMAIHIIYGHLKEPSDTFLSDIYSCLTTSDRCIFWFCGIYLAVYRKLPEEIVQQFEFEKGLPFGVEWPSSQVTDEGKERLLDLMKLAVDKITLDIDINSQIKDQVSLKPLHFLAITHIKCVAALNKSLHFCSGLLENYLNLYPTSIELVLLSARLKENCKVDVDFRGFEELLSSWPKGTPGTHCLLNQYVEHVLADKGISFAQNLLSRWSQGFCRDTNLHDWNLDMKDSVDSDVGISCHKRDVFFGFLNLSLHQMLQNNLREAQCAVDKALKLALPEDYRHCVREHATFTYFNGSKSEVDIFGLLNVYLGDSRLSASVEPLSRRYYRYIKKAGVRQLINDMFGPVSRDFTLVNSVLEVCYGPSLLPDKHDDVKGLVDFVESLMEIAPANYMLALSVYKFTSFTQNSVVANSMKFWASTLLINSIFQAVPVAPEHIWVEVANILKSLENLDINLRFHQQAVSVYPFSIKLWQSFLDLSRNTDRADKIVESARERGVDLSQIG